MDDFMHMALFSILDVLFYVQVFEISPVFKQVEDWKPVPRIINLAGEGMSHAFSGTISRYFVLLF
jgi:hypothetical protein